MSLDDFLLTLKEKKRDYKKEYADFHSKPSEIKRRTARNAARRKMRESGKVRKGDGKDVDHINSDAEDNSLSNIRVVSQSYNRKRKRKPRK